MTKIDKLTALRVTMANTPPLSTLRVTQPCKISLPSARK